MGQVTGSSRCVLATTTIAMSIDHSPLLGPQDAYMYAYIHASIPKQYR